MNNLMAYQMATGLYNVAVGIFEVFSLYHLLFMETKPNTSISLNTSSSFLQSFYTPQVLKPLNESFKHSLSLKTL